MQIMSILKTCKLMNNVSDNTPDFCSDIARIFAKNLPGYRPDIYKNEPR